ncbi:MAG: hypothetical protein AB7R67_21855 [Vicinamibacterales bacterium]
MSSDTPAPTVIPIDPEAEFFADPRKLTRLPVAFPLTTGGTQTGWVEVRDEISIGEQRKAYDSAIKGSIDTPDGRRTEYNTEKLSFALLALHLVDWSLKKPYTVDALKNMKEPVYNAIDRVVKAHIERVTEGNATTPPASGDSQTSGSAGS